MLNNRNFNLSLILAILTEIPRDVKCAILCFFTPPFSLFFSFPRFLCYSYSSYGDTSSTIIIILLTLMLLEAIATSSSSLSLVLPYASECICCWIDCLTLIFIDSFYFFTQIIIGTHCCCSSKPNKTERHFDLLLPSLLLERLCCCLFRIRYVPQTITFIEWPVTEFSLIF